METDKRVTLDGADYTSEMTAMITSVDINDPKSNYFRVFKQLLLIEEHIAVKALNCRICSFKHASTVVALLDEITQMDGQMIYSPTVDQLHTMLDGLPWKFAIRPSGPTDKEYLDILQEVREARKYLSSMFFFKDMHQTKAQHKKVVTSPVSSSSTGMLTTKTPIAMPTVGYKQRPTTYMISNQSLLPDDHQWNGQ